MWFSYLLTYTVMERILILSCGFCLYMIGSMLTSPIGSNVEIVGKRWKSTSYSSLMSHVTVQLDIFKVVTHSVV